MAVIRFYLDEDLPWRAAALLMANGIDATSVHHTGRFGLSDDAQLRFAAAEHRVLVTRNRSDFARWTVTFQEHGWGHAGVLFVPRSLDQARPHVLASALTAYAAAHPDGLPPYMVDYLRRPVR